MKVLIDINDEDYVNDVIEDLEWWLMDYFGGNSMYNIAALPKGHLLLIPDAESDGDI